MSFSKEVKDELANHVPKSRHCCMAELAGLVTFGSRIVESGGQRALQLTLPEGVVLRKYFTLINKTINIVGDVTLIEGDNLAELASCIKLSQDGNLVDDLVLLQPCCKRSFIRGAFLAAGSISDPNKGYHFEIVCSDELQAQRLMKIINIFDAEAKIVRRTGKYVVYIKEGSQIVEMLRVMEASHSVMELENIRVVKEVRGSINRKVNCETANISKTVNAAVRQIEDIRLVDQELGLDTLPENLQEIAQLRLENPDTPLQDLGQLLTPALGKSGVNHRLKKISAIADGLRGE